MGYLAKPVGDGPFIGTLRCIVVDRDTGWPSRPGGSSTDSLEGVATVERGGSDRIELARYRAIGFPSFANDGDGFLQVGEEYAGCPALVILSHRFEGALEPVQGAATLSTELALTLCRADYRGGSPASDVVTPDIGFQGLKARIDGEVVDAVTIFVGGRTGPDARAGHRLMEVVPVTMLDDIIPLIISNMETLRKVQKVPEAEDAVLMVPVVSDTKKKEIWE
jgi:hypothetical protein